MWVLILTIVAGYQSGGAVTAVPGFTSEQACMTAANSWLKQNNDVTSQSFRNRALCAKS